MMRRVAVVGSGPSAREPMSCLAGFDAAIGINEAVRYQGELLTHLVVIDEEAIPKISPFLFQDLRLVLSWQVASAMLAPGVDSSLAMRCRIELRRVVTDPRFPGSMLGGPAGTLLSALWYARTDLGALEAVVFGCDFFEPGAEWHRANVLEVMGRLARESVNNGTFEPMRVTMGRSAHAASGSARLG